MIEVGARESKCGIRVIPHGLTDRAGDADEGPPVPDSSVREEGFVLAARDAPAVTKGAGPMTELGA